MVMTIRNTCRMFDNLFQLVRNGKMKCLNNTNIRKSPEIRVPAFTVVFSWWRRRLATRDRSLSPERVRPSYSVQDGNSCFCTIICQRGGFSSFPGSERRVLSDPNPSIFEKAIEVHVGGDGLPVPSPVFRTVDRSPGLHQGLRSRTLPWDQTSPLSG